MSPVEPSPDDPIVPAPSDVAAVDTLREAELRDDEEAGVENREVAARKAGELDGEVPATLLDEDEVPPLCPAPVEEEDEAEVPEEVEPEELVEEPLAEDEPWDEAELVPIRPAEVLIWLTACPVPLWPPRNRGEIIAA